GAARKTCQTDASWQGQAAPEAIGSGALTQSIVPAEIHIPPVRGSLFPGCLWLCSSCFPWESHTTKPHKHPVFSPRFGFRECSNQTPPCLPLAARSSVLPSASGIAAALAAAPRLCFAATGTLRSPAVYTAREIRLLPSTIP